MIVRAVFGPGKEIAIQLREDGTPTVRALLSALPFESSANRWGDEVYFEAPFHSELERDARNDIEVGEVAFWPDGDAVAIFFGRTPVSVTDKPRAYSPCNIVGKVSGDVMLLREVETGAPVRLSK